MADSRLTDADYMSMALEEAHAAAALDEVPVGAVLVLDGAVIKLDFGGMIMNYEQ